MKLCDLIPRLGKRRSKRTRHDWDWRGQNWICARCGVNAGDIPAGYGPGTECKGKRPK